MMKKTPPDPSMIQAWLAKRDWPAIEGYLADRDEPSMTSLDYMVKGLFEFHYRGNADQGVRCLEQACDLSPQDTRLTNTLSDLLIKSRRYKEACTVAQKSVQLQPHNPLALHALAVSLSTLNQFDQAWAVAEKGLELAANQPAQLKKSFENILKTSHPDWRRAIVGKSLRLIRFQSEHLPFLIKVRQNQVFQHQYNLFKSASEKAIRSDFHRSKKSPLEIKKIEWVIEKNGLPIGLVGLVEIDFKNKRAELQIGFPEAKGYGEALEATLLVLDFAFVTMGLRKLYSYIYSDNPNAQRNSEHLGFGCEGFLVDHVFDPTTDSWLSLHLNAMISTNYFTDKKLEKLSRRFIGFFHNKAGADVPAIDHILGEKDNDMFTFN